MGLQYIDWDIGQVTVINFSGRITLGEGTARLRDAVREALERQRKFIVLNFAEVFYVDSSGLGTLMQVRGEVIKAGGALKLMKLTEITRDLIQVTRLHTLFEVFPDEDSAVASFHTE
jgi:anti-sigma B factor antagonist